MIIPPDVFARMEASARRQIREDREISHLQARQDRRAALISGISGIAAGIALASSVCLFIR
ncbi:MAG: hypothetical protein CL949_13720 [Erythrobacter sp.]|nr:hypothetical protein [Erythrobacter sp.]